MIFDEMLVRSWLGVWMCDRQTYMFLAYNILFDDICVQANK